uniref:class-II fumarase/aspartase family protein n=1 Tax=Marinobacterium profundum TaxID=1714300 RepID=UPI00083795F6|nr:adenylosuccinate lyase family protein [Marinobacterium profundum]
MHSSILDWQLYEGLFTTQAMRHLYSEDSTFAHWLQVEQALALCQADLGMIPAAAAREIAALRPEQLDRVAIQHATAQVGRPIVSLVSEISQQVSPAATDWVHFGATTQDIMDTAAILQLRQALDLLQGQLNSTEAQLLRLTELGQDMPMVGRTNGQHAQPMTFGLKASVWLQEFRRHQQRLAEVRPRVLSIQLAGAVGTLSAMGQQGPQLRSSLAARLELADCTVHWQNARDSMAEVMQFIGLVATSVSKVGKQLNMLASTEIAEVYEGYQQGAGKSSAMPHKRNQRGSEFAEALGLLARQRAGGCYDLCMHEHERSGGAWIMEWVLIPETLLLGAGALQALNTTLEKLQLDDERMRQNMALTGGLIYSEHLVNELAATLGKCEAKRIVELACAKAQDSGQSLWSVIERQPEFVELLNVRKIAP